jgi:hypothetical protein
MGGSRGALRAGSGVIGSRLRSPSPSTASPQTIRSTSTTTVPAARGWARSNSATARSSSPVRRPRGHGSSAGPDRSVPPGRASGWWSRALRRRCSPATPPPSPPQLVSGRETRGRCGVPGTPSTGTSTRSASSACSTASPTCRSAWSRSTTDGSAPSATGSPATAFRRAWPPSPNGSWPAGAPPGCGWRPSSCTNRHRWRSTIPRRCCTTLRVRRWWPRTTGAVPPTPWTSPIPPGWRRP